MADSKLFPSLARVILVLSMFVPSVGRCQIYAGTERATGAVVLSNFRSDDAASVVEGTTPPAGSEAMRVLVPPSTVAIKAPDPGVLPSASMRTLVDAVASRNKLSPALVHAIITAESRYDPRAVSSKGAIGLMQLLPATGKRFGAQDLFSPAQNVAAGSSYLRWLMAKFGGNLELVLAAYNAGEQAVVNAGCRVPAYPETQAYVKRILDDLDRQHVRDPRSNGTYAFGCA